MKKKLIPAVIAGVTLLTIHSNVKAMELSENAELNQIVSDNGQQINIQYEPITNKSSGTRFLGNLISKLAKSNIGAALPTSYTPTFKSKLNVKNQIANGKDTYECWANAIASAFEAYNYVKNTTDKGTEYSARHMNYSSGNVFTDKTITENAYNRNVTTATGGNFLMGWNYSTNGQGPVKESDMSSKNALINIKSTDLKTTNGKQKDLKNYIEYPAVYKQVQSNGSIKYYNSFNYDTATFSEEISDISTYRNAIKQQIKSNGGVLAQIYQIDKDKDVYVPTVKINGKIPSVNHAVFIIGWDDNYLPENDDITIPVGKTWPHKGAYIALSSYGSSNYYDGYIYISYDDFYVEQALTGIQKADTSEYNHAYVHDELGCTNEITSSQSYSIVNIFDKQTSKTEKLTTIGIPSYRDQQATVYYTDKFGSDGKPTQFQVLKKNIDIGIGFTSVDISNANISNNKFAICVTYSNTGGKVGVPVETTHSDGLYKYATVKSGESYIVYTNPQTAEFDNTASSYSYDELKYGTELLNAGIRAYTVEENGEQPTDTTIQSDKYTVKDNMVTRVPVNTTIDEFKKAIKVNGTYTIVDKDGKTATTKLVRTGYKVKVGTKEYEISVIADISGAGGDHYSRALDLAKIRAHIIEKKGSILTGVKLESADINGNGRVDAVDLSKMRVYSVE